MKKSVMMTPIMMSLVACATNQQVTSLDPNIQEMLTGYDQKLSSMKDNGGKNLSPMHYSKAQMAYEKAKEKAYQGKSLDDVKMTINKGEKHFSEIEQNISLAQVHLKDVLAARQEAIDEGARDSELFKEASEELTELGEELEQRDINEVLEERAEVLELYKEAEISAIDHRELKNARNNLKEAQKLDGADYFEDKVEMAQKDINSASKLIREYKDSPNRYREAVMKAEGSTKETLAVSQTASWIDQQDVKSLTNSLSSDLNAILVPFSHPTPSELNYTDKMRIIREEVDMVPLLRAELTNSQMDSFLQKRKMRRISSQNEELNKKLSNKQKMQEKIAQVEEMFEQDEAKILIEGDDLVIRLVGLNFEFNKAKLPEGSEPILKKVVKTVEVFDNADVIIEGHTDAVGDALYNERLSRDRALSVNKYLVANSDLTDNDTRIIGAGFSEPLTENKTATGRKSNRRIDIVIDSVIN